MSQTAHDRERRTFTAYVTADAAEQYRLLHADLYPAWRAINLEFYGGRLAEPHVMFGRTAGRSLGHVDATTDYGGRLQMTFNDGLVFGTNAGWVIRPWPAAGLRTFVHDLLLRFTVRQAVLEIEGAEETGYRGYGPVFAAEANRVGAALGLGPVAARRVHGDERPCSHWPHCVRPPGFYGDDLTQAAIDLAAGTRDAGRRSPAPPSLGVFEYLLRLLDTDQVPRARDLLARQIERLRRAHRRQRLARNARMEAGEVDTDGETPLGAVGFDRDWLLWNGGTVRYIAEAAAWQRDYSVFPILADALEDAGCADGRILRHLRSSVEHTRNCFVLTGLMELARAL